MILFERLAAKIWEHTGHEVRFEINGDASGIDLICGSVRVPLNQVSMMDLVRTPESGLKNHIEQLLASGSPAARLVRVDL